MAEHTKRKIRAELRLKLEGAATPERVEAAARMFREAVGATGVDLSSDSLTMVVSNLRMEARMRGWTQKAARVVDSVTEVVEDPLNAVQRHPAQAKAIAQAIAKTAAPLRTVEASFFRQRGRKPIAHLDDDFVNVMTAAAKPTPADREVLRGTTSVRTVVLRVGRATPGAIPRARIVLGGKPAEVAVAEGREAEFFDAAKLGGHYRVQLHVTWLADARGAYSVEPGSALALGAFPIAEGLSGRELVEQVSISEETFDDIMAGLEDEFADET